MEAGKTRRFLKRFDDAQADWKPHEKSMSALELAAHIVEAPGWVGAIVNADRHDLGATYVAPAWKTRDELLEAHGRITEEFAASLEPLGDDHLKAPWKLVAGGKVLLELSREAAIRDTILSHLIHHRGQLSVYYRLLGIPAPGAYGPSADDPSPM